MPTRFQTLKTKLGSLILCGLSLSLHGEEMEVRFDRDLAYLTVSVFQKVDGKMEQRKTKRQDRGVVILNADKGPLWIGLEERTFSSWSTDYFAVYNVEAPSPLVELKLASTRVDIKGLSLHSQAKRFLLKYEKVVSEGIDPVYVHWSLYEPESEEDWKKCAGIFTPGNYRVTCYELKEPNSEQGEELGRYLFSVPEAGKLPAECLLKTEKDGAVSGKLSLATREEPKK